jgi:hypothetical protein
MSSMPYVPQKHFVQEGIAKSWQDHCAGGVVIFTMVEAGGVGPVPNYSM